MKTPVDLVKLWLHEASRVYGDKLIETKDIETFQKLKFDIAKAGFEVITVMAIFTMVVIRELQLLKSILIIEGYWWGSY